MPHSAPTDISVQPPTEPKSSTVPAPGPQPQQHPHPEGCVPCSAPVQAAAVPPPAGMAAAQGGEQGSSGESSTEQPALQSLIRRLLGGKQQVQQPSQLLQAEHRPSGLKRKLETEAEAAARGGSPAAAAQQGVTGGSDAEGTEQLSAALAKRSRLTTEEMEERRLRDRQVGRHARDLVLSTAFHPIATHSAAGQQMCKRCNIKHLCRRLPSCLRAHLRR